MKVTPLIRSAAAVLAGIVIPLFSGAADTVPPRLAPGSPKTPSMQTAIAAELDSTEDLMKLRDPFKRPEIAAIERKVSELEKYPITDFKMVGALTGPERMRAMVTTVSDGKTHFVAENMKIGQRGGVIRKITVDSIYIREKSLNLLGKEEIEEHVLQLKLDDNLLGKVSGGESKGLAKDASPTQPATTFNDLVPAVEVPESSGGGGGLIDTLKKKLMPQDPAPNPALPGPSSAAPVAVPGQPPTQQQQQMTLSPLQQQASPATPGAMKR